MSFLIYLPILHCLLTGLTSICRKISLSSNELIKAFLIESWVKHCSRSSGNWSMNKTSLTRMTVTDTEFIDNHRPVFGQLGSFCILLNQFKFVLRYVRVTFFRFSFSNTEISAGNIYGQRVKLKNTVLPTDNIKIWTDTGFQQNHQSSWDSVLR